MVTGATGFVGYALTNFLVQQGESVRIFCRKSSKAPSHVEVFQGDICDSQALKRAVSGVDVVYHLAGLIAYSKKHFKMMEAVNVQGTQNVVDACIQNRTQRLIHISSVAAIGASFTQKVLNEKSPFSIEHLRLGYFQTKKEAEDIVKRHVQLGKLDAVILNPATIYGAGDMKKQSRKIQLKVAEGRFPFAPSGGVNVIDIESVVTAIYTATQKGRKGERYILGGENLLIRDLFQMITQASGCKPFFIPLPRSFLMGLGRLGDWLEEKGKTPSITSETVWISTLFHWFDSSKAKAELGLQPKPAKVAIQESIDWAIENRLIHSSSTKN